MTGSTRASLLKMCGTMRGGNALNVESESGGAYNRWLTCDLGQLRLDRTQQLKKSKTLQEARPREELERDVVARATRADLELKKPIGELTKSELAELVITLSDMAGTSSPTHPDC